MATQLVKQAAAICCEAKQGYRVGMFASNEAKQAYISQAYEAGQGNVYYWLGYAGIDIGDMPSLLNEQHYEAYELGYNEARQG